MSKALSWERSKIMAMDPNAPGKPGSLFGLESDPHSSDIIIIPVPWGVTVSYRTGTEKGPFSVLEASSQVDLFYPPLPEVWMRGIALAKIPGFFREESSLRKKAGVCIRQVERGGKITSKLAKFHKQVDRGGEELRRWLAEYSKELLQDGKMVGILGGDHSVPLGFMEALGERYDEYGILHIDAHFDLRFKFEGFKYSHASIMRNASAIKKISKFAHVGIREYCEEEIDYVRKAKGRHTVFFDRDIRRELFSGRSWREMTDKIIAGLPRRVYVSFDIDGLKPYLCQNTGTPVPGGLEFEEVFYLIEAITDSGRKIIGFDLCEVAPGTKQKSKWREDWDSFVGAVALYRLCVLMAESQAGHPD